MKIESLQQVAQHYLGCSAIVDSFPTKSGHAQIQQNLNYQIGEVFSIVGIGKNSLWVSGKSGSNFAIPYENMKLILKPIPKGLTLKPGMFLNLCKDGYDVFNIIGKFAIKQ